MGIRRAANDVASKQLSWYSWRCFGGQGYVCWMRKHVLESSGRYAAFGVCCIIAGVG